ncbi:pyridoxal-phosphate dependent enzyme [Paraburkholderia sp. MM5477-R1]|uniref:pyridoxal-phosphate dependent enzyme n=1 Tax=Paraburkholderia sp. MM5477-R1 TaxID=2991062 RepID=UPI003D1C014B
MQCIRCETVHPVGDYFEGCPSCAKKGVPASVAPHYASFPSSLEWDSIHDWLCYPDGSGLGEGRTPLSSLPRLAAEIGVDSLLTKNEFANPAGSHKDRMGATVSQRAVDVGAKAIAVASSGNAGVSMAAYAARAGVECVVVTTANMSPNWQRAIRMHGAKVVIVDSVKERWTCVADHAATGEWYPATNYNVPPVGSNPFGVDSYRAVALELYLQMREALPTDVVVPTARGDILWGIAKGFKDLQETGFLCATPKVHAVEPFPRIQSALEGQSTVGQFHDYTNMVSIGGDTVTYQSMQALRLCGGSAVSVDDNDVACDQAVLAREGLYLELSGVAALTGLRKLVAERKVAHDARVVLIATSHGYKEVANAI